MEHNKLHNRYKGRRFWVAALVCGFVLAGCAGAKTDATASTQSEPEITAQDVADFTTEGKPTKTIETPWGPKEIYDPAQDVEYRRIYRKWFESGFNGFNPYKAIPQKKYHTHDSHPLAHLLESYFGSANAIVQLDYLRYGCTLAVSSTCNYNEVVFKSDCESFHNFGSIKLSQCERENLLSISNGNGIVGACPFKNNEQHFADTYKKAPDFESSISTFTEFECRKWRNQIGADYWKERIFKSNKIPN